MTGKVPGCAMQTGQIFTFGFVSSGLFLETQNIFVLVFSSACISRPIVAVYAINQQLEALWVKPQVYKSYVARILVISSENCFKTFESSTDTFNTSLPVSAASSC